MKQFVYIAAKCNNMCTLQLRKRKGTSRDLNKGEGGRSKEINTQMMNTGGLEVGGGVHAQNEARKEGRGMGELSRLWGRDIAQGRTGKEAGMMMNGGRALER